MRKLTKEQITNETLIVLQQEINKFRLSKDKGKFNQQQIERTMKRLSERTVNKILRIMENIDEKNPFMTDED